MLSATSVTHGKQAGSAFRGPGLWARVAPFAIVAILAEASLALPSSGQSGWAALNSVVLLLATAAGFLLPWPRLPGWMPVLVPLTYTASVLALDLAAGLTSGVGIVILIPLVWTALFHRRWESVCVVAAVVAVEVIISLTPAAAPDAVVARRAVFWTALGALISVATHGLRDRIQRSRERSEQLQSRLRELTVLADRDRIAADLRDTVIQRIFSAGLRLQSAASQTRSGEVRNKIGATIEDLDETVRLLRDAIFGLEQRAHDRGVRQQVMDVCAGLSPAPEISFSGPVDALPTDARAQLVTMLAEALGPVLEKTATARIDVAADGESCVTMIEAAPPPGTAGGPQEDDFADFRAWGGEAGIHVNVEPIPGGVRVAWQVPLASPMPATGS